MVSEVDLIWLKTKRNRIWTQQG